MATEYPIGGYAPGPYECMCVQCGRKFQGDKRAVQCEPCATHMVELGKARQSVIDCAKDVAQRRLAGHVVAAALTRLDLAVAELNQVEGGKP